MGPRTSQFNITHNASCIIVMGNPLYHSIIKNSPKKPTMVCLPSWKQMRVTEIDIMTYCADDHKPTRFLHIKQDHLKLYLEKINDKTLIETLANGVAYLHKGLSDLEKKLVKQLYNSKPIQVVVFSHQLWWAINLAAYLVIVMDTQYYDSRHHAYEDYPITKVLQMKETSDSTNSLTEYTL